MVAWLESFFVWTVQTEPPPPDTSAIEAILTQIGVTSAPLTVTLLYNAPVDLDLHFYCASGEEIYYGAQSVEAC